MLPGGFTSKTCSSSHPTSTQPSLHQPTLQSSTSPSIISSFTLPLLTSTHPSINPPFIYHHLNNPHPSLHPSLHPPFFHPSLYSPTHPPFTPSLPSSPPVVCDRRVPGWAFQPQSSPASHWPSLQARLGSRRWTTRTVSYQSVVIP